MVSTGFSLEDMQSKPNTIDLVRTKLPWIAAGILFVIYCITINQWVSMRSLPHVSMIAGWDWALPTNLPLFYLITYPFRFLPAGIQPLALNFLSVIFATLTIALLVRSIALLPHDRTEEQRIRQRNPNGLLLTNFAWAPAALAAAVLGLELTMWEHATSLTTETLDLFIFAYLIRCLLEYRLDKNESWLSKLAFLYGIGLTNNWALVGFFPFFLAGVLWVRGRSFFNARFIGRMTGLGLLGMLLYLLIPAVWSIKGVGDSSFWEILRSMMAEQKAMIFNTPSLRARALILSLTSILPVVILCIKFPANTGDISSASASITNAMFRTIQVAFAAACIWVVFDSRVSARTLGLGLPFLTFFYLGALAIGYYIGDLMLVATDPPKKTYRQISPITKLINPIIQFAAWAAVVVVPIALVAKNFKPAQSQNGRLLRDFAETIASQIPDKPAILLADDPYQTALMEAWYARSGKNPHIIVSTHMLSSPLYHKEMVRRHGDRWPSGGASESSRTTIDNTALTAGIASLTESNSVFYLHPSFGFFFEAVYPVPMGTVMELRRYPTNVIFPPRLTADLIQTNQAFWKRADPIISRAQAFTPFKIPDATFVANYFSRALDRWGVDLQRADRYSDAAAVFELATEVNTNNFAARINLEYNQSRGTDRPRAAEKFQTMEEFLGQYRNWDSLLGENGPLDVPEYLFPVAQLFLRQLLLRQAADLFNRTSELVPTNPTPRVALAAALISGGWTDKALGLMADLRQQTNATTHAQKLDLVSMEAAIYFARRDTNRAEAILQKALADYPKERIFYDGLNEMYRVSGQWQKAIALVSGQISQSPTNIPLRLQRIELAINAGNTNAAHVDLDELARLAPKNFDAAMYRIYLAIHQRDFNKGMAEVDKLLGEDERSVPALVYKGVLHMELKQDEEALKAFNLALKYEPGNFNALRNRAIVNLRLNNLNDAKKDYDRLVPVMSRSHTVYYGLGEIAYKKNDRAKALENYEFYLRYAPTNGTPELEEERKRVQDRVNELKAK